MLAEIKCVNLPGIYRVSSDRGVMGVFTILISGEMASRSDDCHHNTEDGDNY